MIADHIIKFHQDHPLMAPKLVSIKFSGSDSNILKGYKALEKMTGQRPKIIKAKTSVAGFKLRKGDDLLVVVTLRNTNLFFPFLFTQFCKGSKFSIHNNHIMFGYDYNIQLQLKGKVEGKRGEYYKSTLLLPGVQPAATSLN